MKALLLPIVFLLFLSVPAFAMDGNVLWLPFDGNYSDISGNGLDGMTNGNVSIVSEDCKFGQCLQVYCDIAGCDAWEGEGQFIGGFVNVSDAPPIQFGTGDFSADFWVYQINGNAPIGKTYPYVNADYGFFVEMYGDQFDFQTYPDEFYTDAVTVNDNEWHHVAVVREGTVAYVYIDGVLETSQNSTSASLPDAVNVTTEGYFTVGLAYESGAMNGKLDEVRLWNRSLSETEINNLMNYNSLDAPEIPPLSPSGQFFADTTKPIVILLLAIGLGLFVLHRAREGNMDVKTMIGIALTVMIGLAFVMAIGGM
jgi:hypothetical protein